MTFFGMALLTAIGTVVLAAFAVVTAVYARKAFREQSREVAAIEQQVKDEQEVTRQQAELLKVQTGQLEVLRDQLQDQRKASAAQAEVLELQAAELRESLEERKQEAVRRHRAQASRIFIRLEIGPVYGTTQSGGRRGQTGGPSINAFVTNSSDQPVYDVELRWHLGTAVDGDPDFLGIIMPRNDPLRNHVFAPRANMEFAEAVVRFTDAAGIRWLRRTDGYLAEEQ